MGHARASVVTVQEGCGDVDVGEEAELEEVGVYVVEEGRGTEGGVAGCGLEREEGSIAVGRRTPPVHEAVEAERRRRGGSLSDGVRRYFHALAGKAAKTFYSVR